MLPIKAAPVSDPYAWDTWPFWWGSQGHILLQPSCLYIGKFSSVGSMHLVTRCCLHIQISGSNQTQLSKAWGLKIASQDELQNYRRHVQ